MTKQEAAIQAIEEAGGPLRLAKKIVALSDDYAEENIYRLSRRIAKWKVNGVAPRFILLVEEITKVPRYELGPELYPTENPEAA